MASESKNNIAEFKTNIGGCSFKLSSNVEDIGDIDNLYLLFQEFVERERALQEDEEKPNFKPLTPRSI